MGFLYTWLQMCDMLNFINISSYKPLTNHLISVSWCLCCFLPWVHVSSFQQQHSTLEENKHMYNYVKVIKWSDCLASFNPIYSNLFSTSNFEAMDTLYDPYLHFCCELALETWAQDSYINSIWVHDLGHTHSLLSLQWSGLSNQRTLSWLKPPTVPEIARQRSSFYAHLC